MFNYNSQSPFFKTQFGEYINLINVNIITLSDDGKSVVAYFDNMTKGTIATYETNEEASQHLEGLFAK